MAAKWKIQPDGLDMMTKKLKALRVSMSRIGELNAQRAMESRNRIYKRTLDGFDRNGKKFKAYSTRPLLIEERHGNIQPGFYEGGYEQAREEAGYSTTPNLKVTGQMLNAMRGERQGQNGVIRFTSSEEQEKAKHNHELYRPFFGLTPDERKADTKTAKYLYDKELKGALGGNS